MAVAKNIVKWSFRLTDWQLNRRITVAKSVETAPDKQCGSNRYRVIDNKNFQRRNACSGQDSGTTPVIRLDKIVYWVMKTVLMPMCSMD